jgi:splicing factor U2AF 35 kDa subunit
MDPAAAQAHFEAFYEDVAAELSQYGRLEGLHVCDNLSDHLVGSVYAAFADEDSAARALTDLSGRFYEGRPIRPEFSPVTDFREAACRQYETSHCARGGYCNFMHLRPVSRGLAETIFGPGGGGGGSGRGRRGGRDEWRRGGRNRRSRSRSRSRDRDYRRHRGSSRRDSPGEREGSEERRRKIEAWNRGAE